MEKLDKKVLKLWIGLSIVSGLIIGGVVSFGVYYFSNSQTLALLTFTLIFLLDIIYPYYRYKNWFFEVHNDHLEIMHGVLFKTSAVIPFVRVQHIDTDRGPIERILGLATLNVYTAGSMGSDMMIPGLSRERAEEMQEELKEKAIQSEKGFDAV